MPGRARSAEHDDAKGREVKKPVYLTDEFGRGRLYDVGDTMPHDVIEANNVGEHIFSDDLTPGDQELVDRGFPLLVNDETK